MHPYSSLSLFVISSSFEHLRAELLSITIFLMIQKPIVLVVFSIGLILGAYDMAYADYRFDAKNANCSLKAYKNKEWVTVPGSELPDDAKFEKLSPVPNSATLKAVRWDDIWYKSSTECFKPADQEAPPPEPEKEAKHDEKSKFFAEIFGQYISFLGNPPSGGSSSTPGVTTTISSYTTSLSYGLGAGLMFTEHQGVSVSFEHISGSQNASISDSGLNVNFPFTASENHFAAHYFCYLLSSAFSPFFDFGLGYSNLSANTTISGFPSPATAYNGTVDFGGSAPIFNLKLALDAKLGSLSVIPYINYEWEKFSSTSISSSSSAIFTSGTSLGASIERMLDLGVGVRYWF